MKNPLAVHSFVFNPEDNGGEQFVLFTYFHQGEDGDTFTTHKFALVSHLNSASFECTGFEITPKKLRELADELEKEKFELLR